MFLFVLKRLFYDAGDVLCAIMSRRCINAHLIVFIGNFFQVYCRVKIIRKTNRRVIKKKKSVYVFYLLEIRCSAYNSGIYRFSSSLETCASTRTTRIDLTVNEMYILIQSINDHITTDCINKVNICILHVVCKYFRVKKNRKIQVPILSTTKNMISPHVFCYYIYYYFCFFPITFRLRHLTTLQTF